MDILLITPYYPPDLGPSAPLFAMLCEDFVKTGNQVTVVAAVPHFPSGKVSDPYKKFGVYRSVENGVNIVRLWVPGGNRSNLFHRFFVFLIFQIESSFFCLTSKASTAIITNPALETWLPFFIFAVLRKKPVLYCVWDIYPEIGIKINIFRNKIVIKIVEWIENYCLNRAAKLHVLTHEACHLLVQNHQIDPEKIFVQMPWVDTTQFTSRRPRKQIFGDGLEDKFIILYSGNIGASQGLENVLDVAKQLQDNPSFFVFIGDGIEKENLLKKTIQENITNVKFLPFQPLEIFPEVLVSADICLISLRHGVAEESIPSKAFPIMASGKPILAFVDPESSIWKLIMQSNTGVNVPAQQKEELVKIIKNLIQNKQGLIEMGNNARTYAIKNFDRNAAAKNMFSHLCQNKQ
jgi:colanic acid biosynthesis glycosyl transferase WcaI